MPGITADGHAAYLAGLEARAEASIRELKVQLERASTEAEREALEARIAEVGEELARKKSAAAKSLF
jgi:hypothetical protein